MASHFRSAMTWLLLLALPLQGFAAATMLNCGPNHHLMWQASVETQVDSSGHASHDQHEHPQDFTDADADADADANANVDAQADEVVVTGDRADGGRSLQQLSKLSKFKCSACAACCLGVALPASPLAFLSFPPASAPTPNVSVPHVDFVSSGLDRPPRLVLA